MNWPVPENATRYPGLMASRCGACGWEVLHRKITHVGELREPCPKCGVKSWQLLPEKWVG